MTKPSTPALAIFYDSYRLLSSLWTHYYSHFSWTSALLAIVCHALSAAHGSALDHRLIWDLATFSYRPWQDHPPLTTRYKHPSYIKIKSLQAIDGLSHILFEVRLSFQRVLKDLQLMLLQISIYHYSFLFSFICLWSSPQKISLNHTHTKKNIYGLDLDPWLENGSIMLM